jgi:hypothetical protein
MSVTVPQRYAKLTGSPAETARDTITPASLPDRPATSSPSSSTTRVQGQSQGSGKNEVKGVESEKEKVVPAKRGLKSSSPARAEREWCLCSILAVHGKRGNIIRFYVGFGCLFG